MTENNKTYVMVPKWVMRMIVVTLVTALVSPWGTIFYVNYVDRKNRSDWCELIVTIDDAYTANPPENETAERFADLMHRRRESLGCK